MARLYPIGAEDESHPQLTSARGLGPSKAIKPEILAHGGAQVIRAQPDGDRITLRQAEDRRRGLVAASPTNADRGGTTRLQGTSPATALATRSILKAAAALVEEDGPFQGMELPRQDVALAARALALNSTQWPISAETYLAEAKERSGKSRITISMKEEVARHFGFGVLEPARMIESPEHGATLIGIGRIRRDQARVFEFGLPPSLSGAKLPRSLRISVAWFSPVSIAKSRYRCAALEVLCSREEDEAHDGSWALGLKGSGPDVKMVGRGSVWSGRFMTKSQTSPEFHETASLPIRVQCREDGKNALSPDDDIPFAIAASFEIETEVAFDVFEEIRAKTQIRVGT